MEDVTVVDNVATESRGGGLENRGNATLVDVTFRLNHAGTRGGAIRNRAGARLSVEGIKVTENTSGTNGDGLFLETSTVSIVGSGNSVAGNGSENCFLAGEVTFEGGVSSELGCPAPWDVCQAGCEWGPNELPDAVRAAGSGSTLTIGPGVYSLGGQITEDITLIGRGMDETSIKPSGNSRVMYVNGPTVTLQDLTIKDGMARQNGGGILNTGHLTLVRVAIRDNQARNLGGGVFTGRDATLVLTDVSVLANVGTEPSGAVYFEVGSTLEVITGVTFKGASTAGCVYEPGSRVIGAAWGDLGCSIRN